MTKKLTSPPVIDAQQFLASDNTAPPPASLSAQIADACRTWGFFQLINTGVDVDTCAKVDLGLFHRLRRVMVAFFDLPSHEKAKVSRTASNAMGWTDNELTKQRRDLKEVFDWCYVPNPKLPANHPDNQTLDGHNLWPQGNEEFQSVLQEYFQQMTRCAYRLLEAFCVGLGIERKSLHHMFDGGIGFARLNYYGSTLNETDELTNNTPPLGIHHHTDAGFLTILLQDSVPGLQVLHDGEWLTVEPIDGALTINVGDMCQVLTNDEFKAPLHRVVATRQKRYSVPFFFNPSAAAVISPLPCFTTDKNKPPRYRPINWGEFRSQRYAGDYADTGEEVQISHYRTSSD